MENHQEMSNKSCSYPKCKLNKVDNSHKMCHHHLKYEKLKLKDYYMCRRCNSPIKLPVKFKTCDECRDKAKKTEDEIKKHAGTCIYIQKSGKQCEYKIKHAEERLCGRHYNIVTKNKEKEEEKNENIQRCNSHFKCDGVNKGEKAILPPNYQYKKCLNCRNKARGIEVQIKQHEDMRCTSKKANGERCTNPISNFDKKMCASHYKSFVKKEQEKQDKLDNVRRCKSRTNCGPNVVGKAILPNNYEFAHCEYCRRRERKKDKERRDKKKQEGGVIYNNMRQCIMCNEKKDKDDFITSKDETSSYCSDCRKIRAEKERKRDRKGRVLGENAKKTKRIWRLKNKDKVKAYLDKYRQSDKYKNRSEERNRIFRQYRKNNPEKFEKYNNKRKADINYRLKWYKKRAEKSEIEWGLSDDYAKELFKESCYYCDEFNIFKVNGIDRINNDVGYIDDNVVPCCTTCNMIKCTMTIDDFLNKVEHILAFHQFIEGQTHEFPNDSKKSYSAVENRAHEKMIYFDLTEEQYDEISAQSCYLCGKMSNKIHQNGLDRVDNNKGYTYKNVQGCCSNCNYMKGSLQLVDFILKLYLIFNKNRKVDKEERAGVKSRINAHFISVLNRSQNASGDIHPRRKIKNDHLEKYIKEKEEFINKRSFNYKIHILYNDLKNGDINEEEFVNNAIKFIDDSEKRVLKKRDDNYEFPKEFMDIYDKYKNIGKVRKFATILRNKVISKKVNKDNVITKLKNYINNNVTKQDGFHFSDDIKKLAKPYNKHASFRKFMERYRKKVYDENINETQQKKDINDYIKNHINIFDYEKKK